MLCEFSCLGTFVYFVFSFLVVEDDGVDVFLVCSLFFLGGKSWHNVATSPMCQLAGRTPQETWNWMTT